LDVNVENEGGSFLEVAVGRGYNTSANNCGADGGTEMTSWTDVEKPRHTEEVEGPSLLGGFSGESTEDDIIFDWVVVKITQGW